MFKSVAKKIGREFKGGDVDIARSIPMWRDKASTAVKGVSALGIAIVVVGAIWLWRLDGKLVMGMGESFIWLPLLAAGPVVGLLCMVISRCIPEKDKAITEELSAEEQATMAAQTNL